MGHHHHVIKSIPMISRISAGGAKKFLAADRERIKKFKELHTPHGPSRKSDVVQDRVLKAQPFANDSSSIDVTDAGVTYTMECTIGAGTYTLLIDTGSSNTWCGAQSSNRFKASSAGKDTGKTVKVSYGSGSFSGEEWTDIIVLGGNLTIKNQGIGAAKSAQGFDGVDGILGIGPADLTSGTVKGGSEVPTVTDNLFNQKTIDANSIGISYVPTSSSSSQSQSGTLNGELTFGGTDSSKFTGEITFTPITSTSPASQYWGIDQSITYGNSSTPILKTTAGIVDTGTTLLYLASDAFSAYQKATGGVMDQSTGLLKVTQSQYDNMESLFFLINGVTFEMTKNAQIWPRALNSELGGSADDIYLVAADNGTESGQGLDFINGFAWLQRFYTVFDTTNQQIGIANTKFTDAETN